MTLRSCAQGFIVEIEGVVTAKVVRASYVHDSSKHSETTIAARFRYLLNCPMCYMLPHLDRGIWQADFVV